MSQVAPLILYHVGASCACGFAAAQLRPPTVVHSFTLLSPPLTLRILRLMDINVMQCWNMDGTCLNILAFFTAPTSPSNLDSFFFNFLIKPCALPLTTSYLHCCYGSLKYTVNHLNHVVGRMAEVT